MAIPAMAQESQIGIDYLSREWNFTGVFYYSNAWWVSVLQEEERAEFMASLSPVLFETEGTASGFAHTDNMYNITLKVLQFLLTLNWM